MPKSTAYANALLKLIFNAIPFSGMARDDAAGNQFLYLALHIADPGVGGDQTTSEISYTGYARLPIARNSGEIYINGNNLFLVYTQYFGQMTGGAGGLATHISIGLASSGAGMILHRIPISPNIAVVTGTRPRVTGFNISEA